MPNASELTAEGKFVGLFVGRSGSGKTVAECSFPGKTFDFDFDSRIKGILGAPWLQERIEKKEITFEQFPPREIGVLNRLNTKFDSMRASAEGRQLNLDNIILDSVTSECALLIQQALPITHQNNKGMKFGTFNITGPEDYKLESQGMIATISQLRSFDGVKNILVSAHIIPRWGKADPNNSFSESVQVGEKLSITDKLGENLLIYFDHIFKFSREVVNGQERFYVEFRSDLARTAFSQLPNGKHDITGKNFYDFMMGFLK